MVNYPQRGSTKVAPRSSFLDDTHLLPLLDRLWRQLLAVCEACRKMSEGVGGPVGEARYRQPPGIRRQAVERPLQRQVDELDVRAVATHEHVPGSPSRLWREQDDPGRVGQVKKVGDTAPGVATRAV